MKQQHGDENKKFLRSDLVICTFPRLALERMTGSGIASKPAQVLAHNLVRKAVRHDSTQQSARCLNEP